MATFSIDVEIANTENRPSDCIDRIEGEYKFECPEDSVSGSAECTLLLDKIRKTELERKNEDTIHEGY